MAGSSYRWSNQDQTSRRRALIGTAVVQVALLFLLLLNGFVTPLPLPGEKGIAISFGDEHGGRGERRTSMPQPPAVPQPPPVVTPKQEATQLTQDFEEAPAIESKQHPRASTLPAEQSVTAPKPTPAPPAKEPERQVDQSALFPGAKQDANASGIGDGGQPGNQGDPNAPLYTGKPGGGGNGGTSGMGKGNGAGGEGISYSLSGRVALQLPPPAYPKQRGGRVVVKVMVNRQGKVVRAEPGEPGSTTFDQSLLDAARKAALQAQFDVAPGSPEIQTGTITYVFQLKQ